MTGAGGRGPSASKLITTEPVEEVAYGRVLFVAAAMASQPGSGNLAAGQYPTVTMQELLLNDAGDQLLPSQSPRQLFTIRHGTIGSFACVPRACV